MASRWFRLLCSLVVSFGRRTPAALAASRSLLVVRFPRSSPSAPRLIAVVMASRWFRLLCSLVVSFGWRTSAALAASRSLLVVRCFWAGFVRVYLGRRSDWRLGVGYREVVGACCGRAAPTAAQFVVWDARRRCLGHLRDDQRFAQIFRRVRRPLGGHRRAGSRAAACGLWSWSGFG